MLDISDDHPVRDASAMLALRALRAIALAEAELGRSAYRSEIAELVGGQHCVKSLASVLSALARSQVLQVEHCLRAPAKKRCGPPESSQYRLRKKSDWQLDCYIQAIRAFDREYKPNEPCSWRDMQQPCSSKDSAALERITNFDSYRDRSTYVGVRILRFLRDVSVPASCKAINIACGQSRANSTALLCLLTDGVIVRSLCPSRGIWLYELSRDKNSWTSKPSKTLQVFDLEFQPENRRYLDQTASRPSSLVALSNVEPDNQPAAAADFDTPPDLDVLLAELTTDSNESIEQLRRQRLWLAIALHQLGVAYVQRCGSPKAGFYDWLRHSTTRWLSATTAEASLDTEAWVLRRCQINQIDK